MTDATDPDQLEPTTASTQSRVREIVDAYLRRRAAGEAVSVDSLLEEHQDLRDELAAELAKLARIDQAWTEADSEQSTRPGQHHTVLETTLLVRCPRCQTRSELPHQHDEDEVHCAACGQHFYIVTHQQIGDKPRRVGRFELIDELGVGSFGTVWRAHDTKLDREVAVKIPRQRTLTAMEMEDVVREARVAARLRHRHIVSVHEVGKEGDTVYIVSDLINGVTLDAWIRKQRPTFETTAQLCRVIAEAHASRPRSRRDSSRFEARQHSDGRARRSASDGLWPGQTCRRRHRHDARGAHSGHAGLHVARAGQGQVTLVRLPQ